MTTREARRNPLLWIRSILFSAPLILVATVFFGTLAIAAPSTQAGQRMRRACQRAWARFVLAVSFVHLQVEGLEKLSTGEACVFCANHLSYLDPPVILAALPMPVRFIAKRSLFSIPFLGWAMRREGDVPIDRDQPRTAAKAIAATGERLQEGVSVAVFPEGGRSFDGELQQFQSGAVRLAIRAHARVVPVAICGSYTALRPGTIYFPGAKVLVCIGDPLATDGFSPRESRHFSQRVESEVREMLRSAGH